MFCLHCGKEIDNNAAFCGYCGGSQQPTVAKKKSKVPIILGSLVAIVAIAASIIIFLINSQPSINKAMQNLQKEITLRLDGSPLQAVGKILSALEDGTTTIRFNHRNTVYDWYADESFQQRDRGNITISAVNNRYKFDYDIFEGDEDGWSQIADASEQLLDYLFSDTGNSDNSDNYTQLFSSFYSQLDKTTEKQNNASVITLTITKDDIMELLYGIYDIYKDEAKSALSDVSDIYGVDADVLYDSALEILDELIKGFNDIYSNSNTITVSITIGSNNRISLIVLDASLRIDGERYSFKITANFGDSVRDRWEIKADYDRETFFRLSWDYNDSSSSIKNTFRLRTDYADDISFSAAWSPSSGKFTISGDSGYDSIELTGVYTSDDRNLSLKFDNLYDIGGSYSSDSLLELEIDASSGSKFDDTDLDIFFIGQSAAGFFAPMFIRYVERSRISTDILAVTQFAQTLKAIAADPVINLSVPMTVTWNCGGDGLITVTPAGGQEETTFFSVIPTNGGNKRVTAASSTAKIPGASITITIDPFTGIVQATPTGIYPINSDAEYFLDLLNTIR